MRQYFAASARLSPLASRCHSIFNLIRRAKSFNSHRHSIARAATHNVNRFKFTPAAQHLTPELTGREASAVTFKFSMKAALFPLRLNELLGGALHLYFGRFTSMSQNLTIHP
jgi:hypothetical protein